MCAPTHENKASEEEEEELGPHDEDSLGNLSSGLMCLGLYNKVRS